MDALRGLCHSEQVSSSENSTFLRGRSQVAESEEFSPENFPDLNRVDPAVVFAGPGYTSMPMPVNGVATAALWISVPAVILAPLAILSLMLGIAGLMLSQARFGVGQREAIAAMVISALTILLWVMLWWMVL